MWQVSIEVFQIDHLFCRMIDLSGQNKKLTGRENYNSTIVLMKEKLQYAYSKNKMVKVNL